MNTVLGLFNYWVVIVLMMTGFYIVISRGNLIKKVMLIVEGVHRTFLQSRRRHPTARPSLDKGQSLPTVKDENFRS